MLINSGINVQETNLPLHHFVLHTNWFPIRTSNRGRNCFRGILRLPFAVLGSQQDIVHNSHPCKKHSQWWKKEGFHSQRPEMVVDRSVPSTVFDLMYESGYPCGRSHRLYFSIGVSFGFIFGTFHSILATTGGSSRSSDTDTISGASGAEKRNGCLWRMLLKLTDSLGDNVFPLWELAISISVEGVQPERVLRVRIKAVQFEISLRRVANHHNPFLVAFLHCRFPVHYPIQVHVVAEKSAICCHRRFPCQFDLQQTNCFRWVDKWPWPTRIR